MMQTEGGYEYPIDMETISKYFQIVDNPEDADFALIGIKDPDGGNGYDTDDLNNGGNGYMHISITTIVKIISIISITTIRIFNSN